MTSEPTELERRAMVDRIQQALAEEQIEFEDIEQRFEQVYAASTAAELEQAGAGLPELYQPPPPVVARHIAPQQTMSLIGDVKVGGWLALDSDLTIFSGLGDVVVDLSSAAIPSEGVSVKVQSLVGDVKVIVPDGARVQLHTTTLIGDRKDRLVSPIDGGPVVRINTFTLLGDARVYSLSEVPPGALRRIWTALRGNRDQGGTRR